MKVSLITTVLNAADAVEPFLASVRAQTRMPDEIVIVDGGSTDGTVERVRAASEGLPVTILEEPGANISRGRNVALAAAAHDVVAVSDADCVLDPAWLSLLLEPLEDGADVAMGFYEPLADSFLQRCMACVNLPDAAEVDPETFMPSARSVAFRRSAIEAAGGYPEWLDIGEDMHVNHRWRELGFEMRFVPEAVARWRLRPDIAGTWTQYFRYSRGDARAGMHARRHALRFGVYLAGTFALASRRTWPKAAGLLAGAAYVSRPVRRAFRRLDDPAEKAAALAAVPALMAFTDIAKMAGYVAGLLTRPERS